jgi:hypothetical protein
MITKWPIGFVMETMDCDFVLFYDNKGFLLAFFFLSSLLKNSEDISKV